ncbi:MAG: HD domain-containing protein [Actinomycetota bacterium]|nr:HD domain-containing protein [Actinomycetota bacterium]
MSVEVTSDDMAETQMYLVNGEGDLRTAHDLPGSDRGISELMHDLRPMEDATDLADLFAALAQSVRNGLNADACLISLYDDRRDVLRDVAASVRPPARLNSEAEEFSLDKFPATRRVLETGESMEISVSDPDAEASERRLLHELSFSRVLMNRFSVDGRAVATIEVYRTADRPFRHDDAHQVGLLTRFAANAYSKIHLASKLEAHYTETIEALVSALEARDPYTEAHAGRISDMAVALSVAMKVPMEQRRAIRLGSILHDVGKIGIADSILQKTGPLSDEEWVIMKKHPKIGERMLSRIDFLAPALPIVRSHHERWDGKGYPEGLAGADIPVGARIVAVCDAFDAMTSDRPYRKAMSVSEACSELRRNSGSQFDPECVELLVRVATAEEGPEHFEDRFVRYAG